nr:2-C-methyl-D-erythritol 4-phosphate cytidylyltransferase [bacterium]
MRAAAIIAAAGIGRRMGGPVPKQYLEIGGRPVVCRTLDLFLKVGCVDELVSVVEPGREEGFKKEILERYGFPKSWRVVAGGAVRQESVANGLALASKDCDVVIVHDGVRPFVSPEKIERAAATAME